MAFEPTTALVGVATAGGRFPPAWRELLKECVAAGPRRRERAARVPRRTTPSSSSSPREHGVELRDLRKPPDGPQRPDRARTSRSPATIVLTVGSDCAIGKMTVWLELDREAQRRGLESVFVPTGQTGIAIAGWGIAVDAVVSDFIAGAAEQLVVEGARRGGELLWVEGQGSLSHPAYSGVTLGLIHGSAPHAFVLCHKAGHDRDRGLPGPPAALAPRARRAARADLAARRGKAKVAAIALNTAAWTTMRRARRSPRRRPRPGSPADDPVRFGAGRLVDALFSHAA